MKNGCEEWNAKFSLDSVFIIYILTLKIIERLLIVAKCATCAKLPNFSYVFFCEFICLQNANFMLENNANSCYYHYILTVVVLVGKLLIVLQSWTTKLPNYQTNKLPLIMLNVENLCLVPQNRSHNNEIDFNNYFAAINKALR